MPVRVIFRGLILFRFPQNGEEDAGKIVAQLINHPQTERTAANPNPRATGHEHLPELQMLSGGGPPTQVVPIALDRGTRVEIGLDTPTGTSRATSFIEHCPNLPDVIAGADPRFRDAPRPDPNPDLVRNVVTVNSGEIRVRNLVTWDEGGFPLAGRRGRRGARPGSLALLKFMGSNVQGHMASEWVVDIDANEVWVRQTRPNQPPIEDRLTATGVPNHRVPDDTIDILITNYETQGIKPVPWGLDFQWLFEAAGYGAADLTNLPQREFENWVAFADEYDPTLSGDDRRDLLDGTRGRPFPYIVTKGALPGLARLKQAPLTDELSRPVCSGGQIGPGGGG